MPLISIIIPVFNEEENLPVLCRRLQDFTKDSEDNFEFIFVDDGSSDRSFPVLDELMRGDARIKAIKFSRNFGSHAACLAGLIHSKGDACAFLSADLQDPPELIQKLIDEWKKGCEVVIGTREWEKGSLRFLPGLYYRLVRKFALKNMPEGGTDVFLISRKAADAVVSIKEKNTSIFGLILWSGFKQSLIKYRKEARHKGASKWTVSKKIKLFIDTFISFSYFPIRFISIAGILLTASGLIYAVCLIVGNLSFLRGIRGWEGLMAALLLISGFQLLMLGILGEYLWRGFDESRNRPVFIIDNMTGFEKDRN